MTLYITAAELRSALQVGSTVTDARLERVSASAQAAVLRYLKTVDDAGSVIDYSNTAGVLEAITTVAVDFFQASRAPGGQAQGLDFTPQPKVNAYIVQRAVQTFALEHMDVGGWVA